MENYYKKIKETKNIEERKDFELKLLLSKDASEKDRYFQSFFKQIAGELSQKEEERINFINLCKREFDSIVKKYFENQRDKKDYLLAHIY